MIISPDNYRVIDGKYVFTSENESIVWERSYAAWRECAARRSTMVVMVGMPRSGKSVWARAHDSDNLAIFDSTGINGERREPLIRMAEDCSLKVHAVVMSTPYSVCVARNEARAHGPLPAEIMERMWERLTSPRCGEGFETVTRIESLPWIVA